jgi:Fic family protein
MKSLEPAFLEKLKFPPKVSSDLRAIGEFKGREELYARQTPDVLEKLVEAAMIMSAESSNRIEGVTAPHARIEKIIKEKTKPRNRSEQEIAGYKDALNLIHQSHDHIPVSENVILQFHSTIYRHTTVKAGVWKLGENEIVEKHPDGTTLLRFKPVSAFQTPAAMGKLVSYYNQYLSENAYDPLILTPLFVFDFLCIHPFSDGNGRISRLLTLLLLYQAGYKVGKYVSLERIIEDSHESYYETLKASSKGWHEGKHDIFPWLEYFNGVLIAAYKEFESRVGHFKKGKGSKANQIQAAVERFVGPFSIVDVEAQCPNASRDTIRQVLRKLRDQGVIKPTSQGRGALWVKKK